MGQFSDLFEQAANISKAHAYDIVAKQRNELAEENEKLKAKLQKLKYLFEVAPDMYENELKIINS